MNPPAIAIDGPAASGKSTVAKLIAKELGYIYSYDAASDVVTLTAPAEQEVK